MMSSELNTERASSASPATQPQVSTPETLVRPPVDITEDPSGVTLYADMPGVSKDRLTVHLEGANLLLEGVTEAGGRTARGSLRYRREFELGRTLDTNGIEASVKDGVVKLRIPKRAENRPRRIEVQ
jgi:HSP20 family molecular chaperone IbpA